MFSCTVANSSIAFESPDLMSWPIKWMPLIRKHLKNDCSSYRLYKHSHWHAENFDDLDLWCPSIYTPLPQDKMSKIFATSTPFSFVQIGLIKENVMRNVIIDFRHFILGRVYLKGVIICAYALLELAFFFCVQLFVMVSTDWCQQITCSGGNQKKNGKQSVQLYSDWLRIVCLH
jgi:hypothetical protein